MTSRTRISRTGVAVVVLCALAAGCNLLDPLTGPDTADIQYLVSGTATRVALRYETDSGTSENGSVTLPWSFTRKAEKDDLLYVSAQIVEGDGTVTAAIYKGDKLLNSASGVGAGATATASGNLD
jgi:hypothetical protein